jgi:hypothetical protein
LHALGPLAHGADYLEVQRWTAELAVAFAEGSCQIEQEELHERTRRALAITNASVLLGLLAWAFHASGDNDQGDHLLAEAFDRLSQPSRLNLLPGLRDWMEAQQAAPPS